MADLSLDGTGFGSCVPKQKNALWCNGYKERQRQQGWTSEPRGKPPTAKSITSWGTLLSSVEPAGGFPVPLPCTGSSSREGLLMLTSYRNVEWFWACTENCSWVYPGLNNGNGRDRLPRPPLPRSSSPAVPRSVSCALFPSHIAQTEKAGYSITVESSHPYHKEDDVYPLVLYPFMSCLGTHWQRRRKSHKTSPLDKELLATKECRLAREIVIPSGEPSNCLFNAKCSALKSCTYG